MRRLSAPSILVVTALSCAAPVLAQHGGGRPSGAGAPSPMGGAPDMSRGAGAPNAGMPGHGAAEANSPTTGSPNLAHSAPGDVLSHNTAVAEKVGNLTGEDAQTACSGFKNLGQCVAAAHVAKNLDIPGGFDALKARMTGPNALSLGKAIQGLNPDVNAKAEAKKANKQANSDLSQS